MSASFIFPMKVYAEYVDTFGIVHHSNYIRFMERARQAWLESLGYRFDEWIKQDVLFVVNHIEIDYLKPSRIHDQLEIVSTVASTRKVSITYDQIVRDAKDHDKIFCKAAITIVCVNGQLRPRPLPDLMLRGMLNG